MPPNRNPKKLTTWISSKRPVGHPNLATRDSFLKSLHFCDSQKVSGFKFPNGKLDQWVPKACNYREWYDMMEEIRDVRSLNEVDFYKTYQSKTCLYHYENRYFYVPFKIHNIVLNRVEA